MISWLKPRAERYRFLPQGRLRNEAVPWIIGMMTFLAALALAGGFGLSTAADGLTSGLARTFTVQIVEADPAKRDEQAETIMSMLRGRSDVNNVTMIGDGDLRHMLEPWLGTGNIGEDLPLPAMIDAEFVGEGGEVETLEPLVKAIAPKARIDNHAQWFQPLAGIVSTLKWLAIIVGFLVTAAMAAIIALGVRSGLSRYQSTVRTLHMLGAEDAAIADIFQYRYAKYGLVGGSCGFAAAFVLVLVIGQLLGEFGGGLAGEAGLGFWGWAALILLPALVTLLSMGIARLTVTRTLKAEL